MKVSNSYTCFSQTFILGSWTKLWEWEILKSEKEWQEERERNTKEWERVTGRKREK